MHLVHLTSSTFFGGPERQMLGLGQALPAHYRSTYLSFSEGGRCGAFLDRLREAGFAAQALDHDTPNLRAAIRELTELLRDRDADILLTHGYKANMLGRIAARRCGVPVVAVSRGWTGENLKVRCYEALDRVHLRCMDAVVCVSEGQARKVRKTGVAARQIVVIRNAARLDAFRDPDPAYRERLNRLAGAIEGERIVVAAGRLSPEKGFHVLVESAAQVVARNNLVRFVLFGEGAQRPLLEKRIVELGLCKEPLPRPLPEAGRGDYAFSPPRFGEGSGEGFDQPRFILAGFRDDLDRWLPWADVVVLPSFTEGLPNVALEAAAAGVPFVATAVGGTPEVVHDGLNGFLVRSGDPAALAERILKLCGDDDLRRSMGNAGRRLMQERFSFAAQAEAYQRLFARLLKTQQPRLRRAA